MKSIQMVDLTTQYQYLQKEIDSAILTVLHEGRFINGPAVKSFSNNLADFTGSKYVIPCANGTDALQIALMALNLSEGSEIIIPAFTYAAAVEVCLLLKLKPVLVDVDPATFNIDPKLIEEAISEKTKAIIPVHLFGQSCAMEEITDIADRYQLFVIEDNAQSIGAEYTFSDGTKKQTGTIGNIGTLSFFPSKNLGAYGDGGALLTDNETFAEQLNMIASHGQKKKYVHEIIGCNSRLDTLQAAVLNVKLNHLNQFIAKRQKAAKGYHAGLGLLTNLLELPAEASYSTHVYHQFTIKVKDGKRNLLQEHLKQKGVPTMVYYPYPIHKQPAFKNQVRISGQLDHTESLCNSVLSLPMHTELNDEQLFYIISQIANL